MGRPVSLRTEVLLRGNQATTEKAVPDLVDPHSRGERILRRRQPLGQFQPVGNGRRTIRAQHQRDAGRNALREIEEVAPILDSCLPWLGQLLHDERLSRVVVPKVFQAGLQREEPAPLVIEFRSNRAEVRGEPLGIRLSPLRRTDRQDPAGLGRRRLQGRQPLHVKRGGRDAEPSQGTLAVARRVVDQSDLEQRTPRHGDRRRESQ